jgi:hypothetical protein
MKISKVKNKTSTENRKDLGEVGVQAKYIFTRIAKIKSIYVTKSPLTTLRVYDSFDFQNFKGNLLTLLGHVRMVTPT